MAIRPAPQPDDALLDRLRAMERTLTEATSVRRRTALTVVAETETDTAFAAGVTQKLIIDDAQESHAGVVGADVYTLPFTGIYILHLTLVLNAAATVVFGRSSLVGTGTIGGLGQTYRDLAAGQHGITGVAPVDQDVLDDGPHAWLIQSSTSGQVLSSRVVIYRLGDLPTLVVPDMVGP